MGRVTICFELDDRDYVELVEMLLMHPEFDHVEGLVKDMVMQNIRNYRKLKEWVKKIISEELNRKV